MDKIKELHEEGTVQEVIQSCIVKRREPPSFFFLPRILSVEFSFPLVFSLFFSSAKENKQLHTRRGQLQDQASIYMSACISQPALNKRTALDSCKAVHPSALEIAFRR